MMISQPDLDAFQRTNPMATTRRPDPKPPGTLHDTGLSRDFVADLLLRTLDRHRTRAALELAADIALGYPVIAPVLDALRARSWIAVDSLQGAAGLGYRYRLTDAGRTRAAESARRCAWAGPAPVPLADFERRVRGQSIRRRTVHPRQLKRQLADLTLPDELLEQLGPALVGGHSIFLHGAPGNGKSAIAERLAGVHDDPIHLPHAIEVDGQIIAVYTEGIHQPVDDSNGASAHGDGRWMKIRRPAVLAGGELTLADLELHFDPRTGIHTAPLQVQALGGVLVIDDFGRQQAEARELLNRWIVPLERNVDHLSLITGRRLRMPFDCLLVFASNDDPHTLVDEGLRRRIRYSIRLGNPSWKQWSDIFEREAERRSLELPAAVRSQAADYVRREIYDGRGIEPRSCHPRDLLEVIDDIAHFRQSDHRLGHGSDRAVAELMPRACASYFGSSEVDA